MVAIFGGFFLINSCCFLCNLFINDKWIPNAKLRSGHIKLNNYLFRIGKSDTPFCIHCNEIVESVNHFMMLCPHYELMRNRLKDEIESLNIREFSLRLLLTGGGFKPNIRKQILRHTFIYVRDTNRLLED